jgi:hypothetical protein
MHKVIPKVVGTLARVIERKRKVETPSPSCLTSSAGFGEETEAKWVTGGDWTLHRTLASEAPARPVSSVLSRRVWGFATGYWPMAHLRVRSVSAKERTLRTGLWLNSVQRPTTLAWQRVARSRRTRRWPASGRGTPDMSNHEMEALGALCCAPNAKAWCVWCGTVLRPVIHLFVGVHSDRWRFAAEVERVRTRGRRWYTGRWLPASGGTH